MLPGAGSQMGSFYLTAQTTQHLSRGSSQAHDLVCAQHLAFSVIPSQQKRSYFQSGRIILLEGTGQGLG